MLRSNGRNVMKWLEELKARYAGRKYRQPFPDLKTPSSAPPTTAGFGPTSKRVPPTWAKKKE